MIDYQTLYNKILKKETKADPCYLVSYRPLKGSRSFVSIDTMWVGNDKKREIRRASLVDPVKTKNHFKLLGYPLAVIDNNPELTSFLRIGGHALIRENIAASSWVEILHPKIVVNTYEEGYIDYETITEKYKKRFARGNFRIEIFDRDNYQCKICGSSPDDGVHVRLEVHHIKPWEEGGISSPENLITLCASCHSGASLINREILYKKIGLSFPYIEHKFFKEGTNWEIDQRVFYARLTSNAVSLKIKNNS